MNSGVVAFLQEQNHAAEIQDRDLAGYDEALKQRVALTIWFDPDIARVPAPSGKRGRQPQ